MIEKVAFTSNTGISTDIKPQNISDKKQKEKAAYLWKASGRQGSPTRGPFASTANP